MRDKRAITHDVFDAIGFGPSSLSRAACAQEHGAHRTWLVFEQSPQIAFLIEYQDYHFVWSASMNSA